MSVSGCGDASAINGTAAELFQLGAMLMGGTAEAVSLVEATVASVEIDPCLDPVAARRQTMELLVERGVARLRQLDAGSFLVAPAVGSGRAVCVEDEDLSAAGISQAQLAEWMASEGRGDLRAWLAALPGARRAIFVQRAVLGRDNTAVAATLQVGSTEGAGWTPEAVGEVYRQALCSLANSLAHAQVPVVEAGSRMAAHA